MAIKVTKLDNVFWTNGSWERPNTTPDIGDFTYFPDLLVDWNDNKTVGVVILTGDYNYAYCEEQWYFLKRLKVADREGAWFYGLVKDWWTNWIDKEVVIRGYCTKTNDQQLLLENLDYVQPIINNPCRLYRLNLSTDVSRHWWEDLDTIRKPNIPPEFFNRPTITNLDWWKFLKQIEHTPIQDRDLPSEDTAEYKKGVTIIAELKTSSTTTHWKQKVLKKLEIFYDKERLKDYVLTKITQLGETTVKNLYGLTLENKGIGEFEETARVVRLDFSGLRDISISSGLHSDGEERKAEFVKLNLKKNLLDREHSAEVSEALTADSKKFKVLQRKVYLPYLRKNWATEDDFLYRTHLENTELSTAQAEDTSVVSGYAEVDPLVPIYQGSFAQGLKSKTSGANFYLPWTYQLDTTINYKISGGKTTQLTSNLNKHIEWFNEPNPPEFGFLIFGQKRDRKDWTWWHYQGDVANHIDIIIGLKEEWWKPEFTSYDRDVDKWVTRVKNWWANFDLLNSLYPYSWIYYFSALKDNSLKISYRDWEKWGGNSGFFTVKPKQEGTINFALDELKSVIQRTADNNTLNLDYFDNVRNKFFDRKAIVDKYRISVPLEKGDIFFSDLTAFWEEYDTAPSQFKFAQELGWYLDTKKDHRILKKNYKSRMEAPRLVFYWNNNIKKYQLGIYYTYEHTYELAKTQNDVLRIKFRDSNAGTDKLIDSADDGITSKVVTYHHIKPIRNESTKKLLQEGGTFQLVRFVDFCKSHPTILHTIDNLLQQASDARVGFNYSNVFKKEVGIPTGQLRDRLPRVGTEYDYEAIYKMINVPDKWSLNGEYYKENKYYYSVENFRNAYDPKAILSGWQAIWSSVTGSEQSNEIKYRNSVDYIKLGDNTFTVTHSLVPNKPLPQLRTYLLMLRNMTDNIDHLKGEHYIYPTTNEFFTRIDDLSLQKDIYQQLNLLDDQGRIQLDDINIKNKLFNLDGTGYHLWIDAEEDAHLIFEPQQAKTDIELEETKYFRIPHTEVPAQDYIDAINQQTDIQIATASYPLQERLLFADLTTHTGILERGARAHELSEYGASDEDEEIEGEDEVAVNSFRIKVHRFSVAGKQNPNDYYIVEYQGARQLLDIKLGIPKRTISSRATDIVALADLAFQRERWREEFKNRQNMWEIEKQRQFEQFNFSRERIAVGNAQQAFNMTFGIIAPLTAGMVPAIKGWRDAENLEYPSIDPDAKKYYQKRHQAQKDWIDTRREMKWRAGQQMASASINAVNSLASSAFNLRELAIQGWELQADINQAVASFAVQANELQTEHIYNSRHFALQLSKIGNVFQQGEVNDRDITDQYNNKKGLQEIHLIYRVPSRIQKEGLSRYYELYGSDCQIPNVEFRFTKVLKDNTIIAFSFIDQITNLWATEEKEAIKTIFTNGVKILSLRKVTRPIPVLEVKPWSTRADELLKEAGDLEKNVLFNKLTTQLDRIAIIKHLAENEPDKNKLVETISPYLDPDKMLAKLATSKDKGELTKFVLKVLNNTDDEKIFESLLKGKDKEKLIESWIEGGANFSRTLWDKYPDVVISVDDHEKAINNKNKIIEDFKEEIIDTFAKARAVQGELAIANQNVDKYTKLYKSEETKRKNKEQALTVAQSKIKSFETEKTSLLAEIAKEKQIAKKATEETANQKLQIDKQIIEINKLKKDLQAKEADLEEKEKTITALRQIEQAKAGGEANPAVIKALLSNWFPTDYNVSKTYFFKSYGFFTDLYEWDSTYLCFYLALAQKTMGVRKFWGASSKGWVGSSWDIQFFWKFDADDFRNNKLKEFWYGGSVTDASGQLSGTYSDSNSYDNSVYVGEWKVSYTTRWFPRIRNKIGSSGYTIETLELEEPFYFNDKGEFSSSKSESYPIEVRLYKDYLKYLGLKWDGEKVVPNTLN